jgi:MMP 1-O-methyltransferase
MIKNLTTRLTHYIIVNLRGIESYKSINGWLSKYEAIGLNQIARRLTGNAIVVEIGSWQGKSTFCIAKGLKQGKVYAIDPFNADGGDDKNSTVEYLRQKGDDDLLDIFLNNMTKNHVMDKVIAKKGYSQEFVDEFEKIDFLFIDGDHSIKGCKTDYELYAHKVVKGGFIAFHDYYENEPESGPYYVVNEIINKTNDFSFYKLYNTLWVGRKN